MKAAVHTSIQMKRLNFNQLKPESQKRQIQKENAQELLHRVEALKDRVSNLRLQCENLRAVLNEKPAEAIVCSECGQQIEHNEEITFMRAAERRTFCRRCFAEVWK